MRGMDEKGPGQISPRAVQSRAGSINQDRKYSINHKVLDGLQAELFRPEVDFIKSEKDAFVNKAFSNGDLSQSTVM